MNPVMLSTAAFCLWDIGPQEKLGLCEALGLETIQIALSTEPMARHFSEFALKTQQLNAYGSVSIHAPWCGIKYGNNDRTKRVLDTLHTIAKAVPLQSVIVRCSTVQNVEPLLNSGLPIVFENSEQDTAQFEYILKGTKAPIALNLNRGIRQGMDIEAFVEGYRSRIERVLVSGFSQGQGRLPLGYTQQFHQLKRLGDLSVPIVLEGLFNPWDVTGIRLELAGVSEQIRQGSLRIA